MRGYYASSRGEIFGPFRGLNLPLKPTRGAGGYFRVTVCLAPYPKRMYTVHVLILLAFAGKRPDGLESRHLDGDQLNNSIENLAYGTKKENAADSIRHRTRPIGEGHYLAKLNDTAVREIRKSDDSQKMLARRYGVSQTTVWHVRHRLVWVHVA